MSKHLMRSFLATCAALLFASLLSVTSAFAATSHVSHSQVANLPCSPTFNESGNGYASMDVPGGWAQVFDHFHQIGCVTFYDHYQFDGYAGADVYNSSGNFYGKSASTTLTTAISFSGVGVSFSLPAGAGFTIQSGPTATHVMSGHDALYYRYSNLQASIFSCFEIFQDDTIQVRIGNSENQTAAQVALSCG